MHGIIKEGGIQYEENSLTFTDEIKFILKMKKLNSFKKNR